MTTQRTPPSIKAKELAKLLRAERADYPYLKSVFRALRTELEISMPRKKERLPEVPTEDDIRRFYQAVWNCRNFADMVLIKTLFYTGVRVSELVSIRIIEVDVERCQIRITQGKWNTDRLVPFPSSFRELLALHMKQRPLSINGTKNGSPAHSVISDALQQTPKRSNELRVSFNGSAFSAKFSV
jgi:integrase/recombinase XerD